jgi:hypothetical protein
VLTGVHSPPQFRVNGPLANLAEFSEVRTHNTAGLLQPDISPGLGLPRRITNEPCEKVQCLVTRIVSVIENKKQDHQSINQSINLLV